MNQRIQQLALESGAWHQVYDEKRFMVDSNFDIEKFAELIVKKCAAEADRQTIYCRGIPWGKWIKQHFGLKD